MNSMQLNIKNVAPFATKEQIDALDSAAAAGLEKLEKGTGAGNDFPLNPALLYSRLSLRVM